MQLAGRWIAALSSGRTLWEELAARYQSGVDQVGAMRRDWESLALLVDRERFAQTRALLGIQQREAEWWRDASLAYFSEISGRPLPPEVPPPAHSMSYYRELQFDFAPGHSK